MTKTKRTQELSRREQQAMDIVYARGKVSAADVQVRLPGNPSYPATRMLLKRLHEKGLLSFVMEGAKYIYSPRTPKQKAGKAALDRLVSTFFDGSQAKAFNAFLGTSSESLSDAELDELERLIANAKARRK